MIKHDVLSCTKNFVFCLEFQSLAPSVAPIRRNFQSLVLSLSWSGIDLLTNVHELFLCLFALFINVHVAFLSVFELLTNVFALPGAFFAR